MPAVIATAWYGNAGAGALLVFSQLILSLQLPFAIVPLLLFTTQRKYVGELCVWSGDDGWIVVRGGGCGCA